MLNDTYACNGVCRDLYNCCKLSTLATVNGQVVEFSKMIILIFRFILIQNRYDYNNQCNCKGFLVC